MKMNLEELLKNSVFCWSSAPGREIKSFVIDFVLRHPSRVDSIIYYIKQVESNYPYGFVDSIKINQYIKDKIAHEYRESLKK